MSRRQNSIRRAKRQRQSARARRNQAERVEKTIQQMDSPSPGGTVSTAATITISGPPVGSHPPGTIVSDWLQLPHPT